MNEWMKWQARTTKLQISRPRPASRCVHLEPPISSPHAATVLLTLPPSQGHTYDYRLELEDATRMPRSLPNMNVVVWSQYLQCDRERTYQSYDPEGISPTAPIP